MSDDIDLLCDPNDVQGLLGEIARRDRIITALMNQVQRNLGSPNSDFALLQTTFVLEEEVQRRTEELELAKSEGDAARSRLSAAVSSMSEGFAVFGPDDRLLLCNDLYLKMWGFSPCDIGRSFEELVHKVAARTAPVDRQQFERRLAIHREGKGGTERLVVGSRHVQIRERRTTDGCTVGVYADITEIADAQAQLLRNAVENINQGMAMFDADRRLVVWNRRLLELLDIPDDLVCAGLPLHVLLHYLAERGESGAGDIEAAVVARMEQNGQPRPYRTERTWPDGTVLEIIARPLPDGGFVATYTDITASVEAKRALEQAKMAAEQANEAKSRFLAAASHDLRQPLQALNLYLSVLMQHLPRDCDAIMRRIDICVASLSELLTDLLELSKLDAGVIRPKFAVFPLRQILDKAVASHAGMASKKGLRLRMVPSSLHACTDAVLFERIVTNLVSNAVRYTRQGGVVVGCRRRRGRVWLEVSDTGIGVPQDKQQAIFEEFRQLANPERSREKGSGLGLAIVRKAAGLLGLDVRLTSFPGRGSTFAVEVPICSPMQASAPPDIEPPDTEPSVTEMHNLGT